MKLALLGYGKMGKMVESNAIARGHNIILRHAKGSLCSSEIKEADLCIDFSHPDAVLKHIQVAAELKKNIVVGTTGWYHALPQVEGLVRESGIGLLYGPNFSLGILLFKSIVNAVAKQMNVFDDYDAAIFEAHHSTKVDSPSGTAMALADALLHEFKRKTKDTLSITSLRCGHIPGKHSIVFDSPEDTITLTHEARNRNGFAKGAVVAAEWLLGKQGIFTADHILGVS